MDFSCLYFNGFDLSETLVFRRGRESICVLNETTPRGVTMPCGATGTVTRVNDTHILLKTNDELDVTFMEYGSVNETGKSAEPIAAGCPYSPELLEVGESPDGHTHQHYVIVAAVVLVIILCLIAFFIYKKYEIKRRSQRKCNEYSATFTKCPNKEDTENGHVMNGTGQAGPQRE